MTGCEILVGDCRETLRQLPDGCVQTCVTSPPYFGLRDYGHPGQLGLEPSPDAYVAELVAVFREVRRVLRDDGTLWLNLGDSYASGTKGTGGTGKSGLLRDGRPEASRLRTAARSIGHQMLAAPIKLACGVADKNLLGIPWRVAFALQADGWILRADVVWHKPNPMPESVRDRPTRAHEFVFLLAKQGRYFYDADSVREPMRTADDPRNRPGYVAKRQRNVGGRTDGLTRAAGAMSWPTAGRNLRDVWTVTPRPYKGAHFAVMPPALVEPCVKAGTSERGCCPHCGAPWEREVARVASTAQQARWAGVDEQISRGGPSRPGGFYDARAETTGWRPTCACPAHAPVPCLVMDPFGGSGTVAEVALRLGRRAVVCELNPDYVPLIHARVAAAAPAEEPAADAKQLAIPGTGDAA